MTKRTIKIVFIWMIIGFLAQSCGPPMCPLKPSEKGGSGCNVRMQHVHGGEVYKGKAWYKPQHLKYGQKTKQPPKHKYKKTPFWKRIFQPRKSKCINRQPS
ncbi:hypothetical protein R9C00_12785 [Flammeovirgaceae bacterium SG7u.111]|nr:hypothetical protein [Flammeovirgaceae bacterium SG7u.132]WPO38330.1 hypothetical protein R9C00_12785 [Flammeovirgaceae bacterium SG7u.111]